MPHSKKTDPNFSDFQVNDAAHDIFKQMLDQGCTTQEIENQMIEQGIDSAAISSAYDKVMFPIQIAIRNQLKQGTSFEDCKKSLLAKGYLPDIIEEAKHRLRQ